MNRAPPTLPNSPTANPAGNPSRPWSACWASQDDEKAAAAATMTATALDRTEGPRGRKVGRSAWSVHAFLLTDNPALSSCRASDLLGLVERRIASSSVVTLDHDAVRTAELPLPAADSPISQIEPVAVLASIWAGPSLFLRGTTSGSPSSPEVVHQQEH